MPDELTALRKVSDAAKYVWTLERELVNNKNPRLVMDRLKEARRDLDAELAELVVIERGR